MKELIEFMVKALVDDPSEVNITEIQGDKITLYELRVSKTDIGKVIGKRRHAHHHQRRQHQAGEESRARNHRVDEGFGPDSRRPFGRNGRGRFLPGDGETALPQDSD